MPKLTIDVRNKTISQLIDEANSGKFFLPSFQRSWEWDEDDVRDLIESIVNQYPINNIILWKPSETNKEIDPFSKPLINSKNRKEINYIIDGQQRLTSLLLLFNNWKITRDGGEEASCEVPISFHPTNKRFYKSSKIGEDLSKLVRAFAFNDTDHLRELMDKYSDDRLQDMKDRVNKILNYPVPIYIMETYEEDEETFKDMAEAFIRVNKYGVRIGNLELMLSFLAGAVSGELKGQIRYLYEDLYDKFKIGLQPVIRFTFSNFGLKQTQISKAEQFRRNIDRVSQHDSKTMKNIFEKCDKALELTIDLITKKLGINNSQLLPSQLTLIPISAYLYENEIQYLEELNDKNVRDMLNWFIVANFKGYYSSRTDTKLEEDLNLIKNNSYYPFDELLENMKNNGSTTTISYNDIERGLSLNVLKRYGRSHLFLLYIILVQENADDWNGIILNKKSLKDLAKHHIFPKDFLEQNLVLDDPDTREVQINNIGNISFIDKFTNSEIGATPPEGYLEDYIDSADKHFIPTDKNLWSLDQYSTFLDYRVKQIYRKGKEQFGDVFE